MSRLSKFSTSTRNYPGSKSRSTFPNTFMFQNTLKDRYSYAILKGQKLKKKQISKIKEMKLIPEKKKKETKKQLQDDLVKERLLKIRLNLLESRTPKTSIKNNV
jgi:hypothetical protein